MASRSSGGNRNRGRYNRKFNKPDGQEKGAKDANVDESSPIIQAFRGFQKELDNRNDRHERVVKLSRDITIESKRIIFTLQRCSGLSETEEKQRVLEEAAVKFEELNASKFYALAQELEGQDPYQFLRAYSPGLQEYIEAVTFYHYLLNEHLVGLSLVSSGLKFDRRDLDDKSLETDKPPSTQTDSDNTSQVDSIASQETEAPVSSVSEISLENNKISSPNVSIYVPPSEYMLGVADFTGELMRMAINSVGAGDLDTPAMVTNMMRVIHTAFTNFTDPPRELRQKTRVLGQSLRKVEQACYTLRVRGSEIPKHMLADVFSSGPMESSFATEELDDMCE